jgi:hypothetical protein
MRKSSMSTCPHTQRRIDCSKIAINVYDYIEIISDIEAAADHCEWWRPTSLAILPQGSTTALKYGSDQDQGWHTEGH